MTIRQRLELIVGDLAARFDLFVKIIYLLLHRFQENQALIAANFGHQVGKYLASQPNEKLFTFLCLVCVILYVLCKSGYIRSKLPNFVKFVRLRLRPIFSLVVTAALLSYLAMIMYPRGMEMEADYIGWMLGEQNQNVALMSQLYPRYGVRNQSSFYQWFNIFLRN